MIRSTPWRLSSPPRAFKNSRDVLCCASGNEPSSTRPEIVAERRVERRAHRHEALLRALPGHEDQLLVEVEVPRRDADDL